MKIKSVLALCSILMLSGCIYDAPFQETLHVTIDGTDHTITGAGSSEEDFDNNSLLSYLTFPKCTHGCGYVLFQFDGQGLEIHDIGFPSPTDPKFDKVWDAILSRLNALVQWDLVSDGKTKKPADLQFYTDANGQYQLVPQPATAISTTTPSYDPNFWGGSIITTPPTINTTTSSMVPSN